METKLIRYLHQPLRYDWRKKLARCLETQNIADTICALMNYQGDYGLDRTGFVDAQTRLQLIEEFPLLRLQQIGKHLDTRCFIDEAQTESAIFDRIKQILLELDAVVLDDDFCPQILAIRGIERRQNLWIQTDSARQFAQTPYGNRTHFSAQKPNYNDTLMAILWQELNIKHVRLFSAVSNPASIWPYGTAHLANGQYFYRLGRHRTRERAHIESVKQISSQWPNDWIFDVTEDSIQYLALEGTSSIEVIRSHGNTLDLSEDDYFKAEQGIAHADPTYVDAQKIKINIHTCATEHASSLGCQNILPQDYAEWMSILLNCRQKQIKKYGFELEIPYTLCDASYIE